MGFKVEKRDTARRRSGASPDRLAVKESLHKLNRIVGALHQDKDEIARLKADTRRMLDQLSAK
jgi:hypothetical protein